MDKKIIALVETSPKKAFNQLYDMLYKKIFAAKRYQDLSTHDKRDIFHDALLVFYLKVKNKNTGEIQNLEAWFSGTCRNVYFKKIKKEIKDSQAQEEFHAMMSNPTEENYELVSRVVKIMKESLDQSCVELLTYHFSKGLDFDEIAEKMNYTRAFVKNKKSRCLKRLRSLVKNESL